MPTAPASDHGPGWGPGRPIAQRAAYPITLAPVSASAHEVTAFASCCHHLAQDRVLGQEARASVRTIG
jgi:hypothetical protein